MLTSGCLLQLDALSSSLLALSASGSVGVEQASKLQRESSPSQLRMLHVALPPPPQFTRSMRMIIILSSGRQETHTLPPLLSCCVSRSIEVQQ